MTAITMLILFVAVQLVTGLGALLFSNLDKLGTGYPIDQLAVSPMATGISMLVGEGLLALGLWLWFFRFEKGVRTKSTERPELLGIFKFHKLKRDVVPVKPTWWQVLSAILGVLMMAIALSQALTTLGMNNDADMALFQGMLGNPLCWLLLCIVGPVCEELVFRVGIVRTLYRHKVPGWAAAAIGALAFALVHGNVTQGIPAFIIGVVLGLYYLRSGNLRLCLPAHIANNTLAVVLMALGQDDAPASWWSITIRVVVALLLVAGALMPLHRAGKAAQGAA